MIGLRTALILFALLALASWFALTGLARAFCLLIIGGLAAKAVVHYYRKRLE